MGKFEIVMFLVLGLVASTHAGLIMGYYNESCPNAEAIVRNYTEHLIPKGQPSLASAVLRMFFHDCFVRGCDASVLLNSTSSGNNTERTSTINLSLRGFGFIDKLKSKLEEECPGVVSCADILALATRDAILSIGGPYWDVPTGRRDGTESKASETVTEIPFPTDNLPTLEQKFTKKGLNQTDLLVLSGAHTIGISHCTSFTNRLYNSTGKGGLDPTLDSKYATELKSKCPAINSSGTVPMDPRSNTKFDLSYYKNVLKQKGLFGSDAALVTKSKTNSIVNQLADGSLDFYKLFADAMVKMGNIEVKTKPNGQVRTNCALLNK